jgi:hypothetical protein
MTLSALNRSQPTAVPTGAAAPAVPGADKPTPSPLSTRDLLKGGAKVGAFVSMMPFTLVSAVQAFGDEGFGPEVSIKSAVRVTATLAACAAGSAAIGATVAGTQMKPVYGTLTGAGMGAGMAAAGFMLSGRSPVDGAIVGAIGGAAVGLFTAKAVKAHKQQETEVAKPAPPAPVPAPELKPLTTGGRIRQGAVAGAKRGAVIAGVFTAGPALTGIVLGTMYGSGAGRKGIMLVGGGMTVASGLMVAGAMAGTAAVTAVIGGTVAGADMRPGVALLTGAAMGAGIGMLSSGIPRSRSLAGLVGGAVGGAVIGLSAADGALKARKKNAQSA